PVLSSVTALGNMFAILWQMDAALSLLALLVIPCMIVIFRRYAVPMMEKSYAQQAVESEVYDVVEQTLSAMPVVQAFGREEQAERRLRGITGAVIAAALAAVDVQLRFKVLMGASTALG